MQNKYNLTERKSEPTLRFCEDHGIAFLPWYPLAAGKLAHAGSGTQQFAAEQGLTLNQLSLAWLLQRSPVMLPIPGTSSIEHLEENVTAANERSRRSCGQPSSSFWTRKPADRMAGNIGRASRTGVHCYPYRRQENNKQQLGQEIIAAMIDMKGKIAVVFGLANKRSIAYAIAQKLAESGATLVLGYQSERLQREAEQLLEDLGQTGIGRAFHAMYLTTIKSMPSSRRLKRALAKSILSFIPSGSRQTSKMRFLIPPVRTSASLMT